MFRLIELVKIFDVCKLGLIIMRLISDLELVVICVGDLMMLK